MAGRFLVHNKERALCLAYYYGFYVLAFVVVFNSLQEAKRGGAFGWWGVGCCVHFASRFSGLKPKILAIAMATLCFISVLWPAGRFS
jgi:hypothetical protein